MQRHDAYAALRVPDFRRYVASHGTMTVATQIQAVVVGWQVYSYTHDPLSLGLIGLAEALPFIAVALHAGNFADLHNRKRIALYSLAALTACAAALLWFALQPGAVGPHRVWPIYAVIFASGIGRSFLRPASFALSADIIPRELYPNAITWRTSIWQFAAVTGPAAGGLLYGFSGMASAYATDLALMIVAFLGMASVRYERPASLDAPPEDAHRLTGGLRFVFSKPIILGAMSLDLFSVLFGGAVALLPIYASDILHVGPQGLGILRAAPAAGSVLMGIALAHRPPIRRAGPSLFVAVALFGASMIAFGISRHFMLSVFLLFFSGAVDNVSIVIRATLLQTLTPHDMFGRVSAVNQIFIGSSNEIGAFESGLAAKLLGTVPSVVFGGVMTLLVVGITAWRVPALRKLREIG